MALSSFINRGYELNAVNKYLAEEGYPKIEPMYVMNALDRLEPTDHEAREKLEEDISATIDASRGRAEMLRKMKNIESWARKNGMTWEEYCDKYGDPYYDPRYQM